MQFSERQGYRPVRKAIQIESIDEELRNGLSSVLNIHVWDHVLGNRYKRGVSIADNEEIETFCGRLWFDYYKKPLDTLGVDWIKVHTLLRKGFFQADYPDQILYNSSP